MFVNNSVIARTMTVPGVAFKRRFAEEVYGTAFHPVKENRSLLLSAPCSFI